MLQRNRVFYNAHRLRSGWRVLGFFGLFTLLSLAFAPWILTHSGEAGAEADTDVPLPTDQAVQLTAIILLLPLILATLIMVRFVDRRALETAGYPLVPAMLRELALGAASGALLISAFVALLSVLSELILTLTPTASVSALLRSAGGLLASAAFEETLVRGYLLQALIEGVGLYPATLLTSLGFSLLHYSNPNVTLIGYVNIALVGVLLSLAYIKTKALWFPIAFHFSWNLLQGVVYGLPVSGIHFSASVMGSVAQGSAWLTGGSFGPEGSIVVTLLLLVGLLWVVLSRQVRADPDVEALWQAHLRPAVLRLDLSGERRELL